MIQAIVDKFSLAVASFPSPAVAAERIGSAEPASPGDLPRVVLSVQVDDTRGTGLERLARPGEIPVQQRTTVEVAAGPDTFSPDLRKLRLAPLPLKKNPALPPGDFGAEDVTVADVSGASPVTYTLTASPRQVTEFALDVPSATIVFGTTQPVGHKLEVTHWTVHWRDDVIGARLRGRLCADLWANDAIQLDGIARKLADHVFSGFDVFRRNGFARLTLMGLDSIASSLHQPGAGTAFAVWKQRLGCQFVFDYEAGGADSQGIPIKQIKVDPQGLARETVIVS